MRIAIIGAGNVGGRLAGAASNAGHDVVVSASSPDNAQETATETGATAAGSHGRPWQSAFELVGPTSSVDGGA